MVAERQNSRQDPIGARLCNDFRAKTSRRHISAKKFGRRKCQIEEARAGKRFVHGKRINSIAKLYLKQGCSQIRTILLPQIFFTP